MGVKLHVDAIGNHPKIFFLQLSLFSLDRKYIFKDSHQVSEPLPKFATIGNDTHAHSYVRSALIDITKASQNLYQVSKQGHMVAISSDPVILSGDGAVKPMFTGGPTPTHAACAIYEVCSTHLFVSNPV